MALAPDGVRAMFADQLNRPLQVESLGSAVLMAAQRFGMRPLHTINSHGAQALSGRGAGLAADLSTVFEVATVAAIWIIFARRRNPDAEAVLLAAGAAVAALVAFDRVLSPQYLIWIIPFALLVGGERGLVIGGLLFLALGLTQAWQVADHYWSLAAPPCRAVLLVPARARPHSRPDRRRAARGAQPRTRFRSRNRTLAGRSASRRMR